MRTTDTKESHMLPMRYMILLGMSAMMFFAGCAMTAEEKARYDSAQANVSIADSLSAGDTALYRELGPVECRVNWKNIYDDPTENCRKDLKSKTADRGGTLVIIESRKTFKCELGDQSAECIEMHGRAYAKRESAPVK